MTAQASAAYADAKGSNSAAFYSGNSHILLTTALTYQVHDGLHLTTRYEFTGDRGREPGDPRNDLSGYSLLDFTAIWSDAPGGTELQLTIKNLFDTSIKQPALAQTYPEDYPRPGRALYVSLSKHF